MSLIKLNWLRRFVRKNTKPIPVTTAEIWKRRLALGYALIAWQGFGVVLYLMYKGYWDAATYQGLKSEEDLALTPAQQWSKTLGIKNATVYRVVGFNVNKYEIHNKFDEESEQRLRASDFNLFKKDNKKSEEVETTKMEGESIKTEAKQ